MKLKSDQSFRHVYYADFHRLKHRKMTSELKTIMKRKKEKVNQYLKPYNQAMTCNKAPRKGSKLHDGGRGRRPAKGKSKGIGT